MSYFLGLQNDLPVYNIKILVLVITTSGTEFLFSLFCAAMADELLEKERTLVALPGKPLTVELIDERRKAK